MDYNNFIELDDVTLEDCERFYERSGLVAVINDGRLINFEKEVIL